MNTDDCIVAVFKSTEEAQQAVADLEARNFSSANVSLITRGSESELDATRPLDQGDQMEKTAAVGAGVGAALGLLAGSALLIIPGIGPVVFAGAMASGITGGLVGGIVGAMSGWGIKEDRLRQYEQQVRNGKTLVVVTGIPEKLAEAKSLLLDSPAEHVMLHAESADSTVDD
jgi:VIT1/CCC1 family predicted Fe2+/Mn2+ transporter